MLADALGRKCCSLLRGLHRAFACSIVYLLGLCIYSWL